MSKYSSREAASRIGIHLLTLQRYTAGGKIPAPPVVKVGGVQVRLWGEKDIANVRKVLPKIANGRKTRHQKQRSAVSTHGKPGRAQQSAKAKKKKSK